MVQDLRVIQDVIYPCCGLELEVENRCKATCFVGSNFLGGGGGFAALEEGKTTYTNDLKTQIIACNSLKAMLKLFEFGEGTPFNVSSQVHRPLTVSGSVQAGGFQTRRKVPVGRGGPCTSRLCTRLWSCQMTQEVWIAT